MSTAPLTIACVQTEPIFGDVDANLSALSAAVATAAGNGAQLVVAPELCTTGYVFESRDEAFELADAVGDAGPADALADLARELGVHLVAGFAERDGARLYNSALIAGPGGPLGVYRKLHLWENEALFFERGDRGMPVFATPHGRIAAMVCYDAWFPELWRLAAVQGADLICLPTNWVPIPGQADGQMPMANVLCMAAAHSNSLFVAAADRVGTERGQPFIGSSLVVAPTGWPVAGPASPTAAETVLVDVDLAEARRQRAFNTFNHLLRDRRTDIYDRTLGSGVVEGWH
jgi:N-carbamoylputrescine amidase